jgi:hypothetical protein
MRFSCPIPPDMRAVIDALAEDANIHWYDADYDEAAVVDDFDGFENCDIDAD